MPTALGHQCKENNSTRCLLKINLAVHFMAIKFFQSDHPNQKKKGKKFPHCLQ